MHFQGGFFKQTVEQGPYQSFKTQETFGYFFHQFQTGELTFCLDRVNDLGDIRKDPLLKEALPTQPMMPKLFRATVRDETSSVAIPGFAF